MSRIRTNIITNRMANGAPTVSNGLIISGVTTTSDIKVGTNITLTTTGNGNFSGIVTATSADINGDLDVDGHTNLDNVSIAGVVTATTFSGSGASLTSIPAGNLTGTVADARISTLTASKLSGALPAIDGSNLTGIDSGVTSDSQNNTVGGTNAGDSFSGTNANHNTLFGYDAGTGITSGDYNTAIGSEALDNGNLAADTVAVGYRANKSSTTGMRNVAVGSQAMLNSTDAAYNVAVGFQAGRDIASSSHNVAVGYEAGYDTPGGANTFVGSQAGKNLTSGSSNILIGYNAQASTTTTSNEVTIGDTSITKFRIPGIGVTFASSGNNISGITTFSKSVHIPDAVASNDYASLYLGTGNDVRFFHNGQHTFWQHKLGTPSNGGSLYIDSYTSTYMRTSDGSNNVENAIVLNSNSSVDLYYSGTKKFETRGNGTQVTGTVLAGSSTPAAENSTYVFQAVGASQAFISAYASNTGTNLNSHGIHFGQDTSRGYLTQRENKDIYFYTNNTHRLTLQNSGNLVPASDNTYDLGVSSLRWRNLYTTDLHLSNEGKTNEVDGTWGDWTLQEGENKIFMINNRTGKKYSLKMEEE